jgi:hypothetical protein
MKVFFLIENPLQEAMQSDDKTSHDTLGQVI